MKGSTPTSLAVLLLLVAGAWSQAPPPVQPTQRPGQTPNKIVRQPAPYAGPQGGGAPGYPGPSGGGEPSSVPGSGSGSGGTTPPGGGKPQQEPGPPAAPNFPGSNPQGGGTTPAPGGQPPVGPRPPAPEDPNGRPLPPPGRTGAPPGLPYSLDRWENWWLINRDVFLDVDRNFARRALAAEVNSDVFLGAELPGELGSPLDQHVRGARHKLIPLLIAQLEDPKSVIRGEAALALGKVGEASEVPVLGELLGDSNRFVRQMALLGLGLTGDPSAVAPLAGYLIGPGAQDAERVYAAVALGLLGQTEALAPLASVVEGQGSQREVAAAALYAIGFIPGDGATMMLRSYANNLRNQGALRAAAVLGLGKQRDLREVPALLRHLTDSEIDVRRSAALALGQFSFESPLWERRDQLLTRLREWESGAVLSAEARGEFEDHLAAIERRAALETRNLAKIQHRVIERLEIALDRDSDRMVRNFAAIALGRIGSSEARTALFRAFRKGGGSESTRSFVTLALGVSRCELAADLLRNALVRKGVNHSHRGALCLALGLVGDRAAGSPLRDIALGGADPTLRGQAAVASGLIGDAEAVPHYLSELRNEAHQGLRPDFSLALALLGRGEVVEILKEHLVASAPTSVKVLAVQSIGMIRDLRALDALEQVIRDPSGTTYVRAAAIHAAGQVAEKGDLPILEPLVRDWNYALPFSSINDALLR